MEDQELQMELQRGTSNNNSSNIDNPQLRLEMT